MNNLHKFNEHGFMAWLRRQNPDRKLVFCDTTGCMIASWLIEEEICDAPNVGSDGFSEKYPFQSHRFPHWLRTISGIVCDRLSNDFTARDALVAINEHNAELETA
jgi:hypothetical protein